MLKKEQLIKIFSAVVLCCSNIIYFWQFYFKGLLPFPGNLLVSYYFPWTGGSFPGFDPWTTRKGVVSMDVIRQMFPWKSLGYDLFHQWQWPLWNPYNFSGSPLLANLQSSFFFPINILYAFLPLLVTWITSVILLPLLFSVFNYIFLKSFRLDRLSALFGSIVITGISYLAVWAEQLVVIQSTLFLPLILWQINLYSEKKDFRNILIISILLAFTIFGGHIQTAAYVFLISSFFALYKKTPIKTILFFCCGSLILSSVQLLPSLELYLYSARDSLAQKSFISQTALPWQNLITILTPDFFGNPATNNLRMNNYDNSLAYFGIVGFLISLFSFKKWSDSNLRFFVILGLGGLIFSLPPFAYFFTNLHIPILGSSYLSRATFIFEFCFAVVSAFGFDWLRTQKFNFRHLIPTGLVSIFLILILGLTSGVVSRGSILVPLALCLATGVGIFFLGFLKLKNIAGVSLILLASINGMLFFTKYQPFSPEKFVFPTHPIFSYLQRTTGYDRFYGSGESYVDSNFATYLRLYTPEGYDPLYISRYGELLASTQDGTLPPQTTPSDAVLTSKDTPYRQKLLKLLGVKYYLDKINTTDLDPQKYRERYPENSFKLIHQINNWRFYEDLTVLPRTFLVSSYQVETDPSRIISKLYEKDFALDQKSILETKPGLEPQAGDGVATITTYSPNEVLIQTTSNVSKLLFLSDNYYPGWKAFIDNKETEILRANYTFRAVAVASGQHEIKFIYQPFSFYLGLIISLISIILLPYISKKI